MADHVIDTNVLIVASVADPSSPFEETHVPAAHQASVFEWLSAFRRDSGRVAVVDQQWRIWNEYCARLTEQDFGFLVMREKLSTARFHNVHFDYNGHAILDNELQSAVRDPADRKFVAVALADGGRSTIVNATDPGWFDAEAALAAAGIKVEQVLEAWLRGREAK